MLCFLEQVVVTVLSNLTFLVYKCALFNLAHFICWIGRILTGKLCVGDIFKTGMMF